MSGLDNWNLQPLAAADRQEILSVFGLHAFSYLYEERVGSQVIRFWEVGPERTSSTFPEDPKTVRLLSAPLLTRTHQSHSLAEVPLLPPLRLWEDWFPFPFRLWGTQLAAEASGSIQASDPLWRKAGLELAAAVERIQSRLFQAEISVLSLQAEGRTQPPVTLLFHAVRKRFLASGRLATEHAGQHDAELARLGASFQSIALCFSQKDEFLGQIEHAVSQIDQTLGALPAPSILREGNADLKPLTL